MHKIDFGQTYGPAIVERGTLIGRSSSCEARISKLNSYVHFFKVFPAFIRVLFIQAGGFFTVEQVITKCGGRYWGKGPMVRYFAA